MLEYLGYVYIFVLAISIAIALRVDRAFQGGISIKEPVLGSTVPEPDDPDDPRPLLVLFGSLLLILGSLLPSALIGRSAPVLGRLLLLGTAIYSLLLSRWRLYRKIRLPAGIALSMVLYTLVFHALARAEDPALAAQYSSFKSQFLPLILPCIILSAGALVLFIAAGRLSAVGREGRPEFHRAQQWRG